MQYTLIPWKFALFIVPTAMYNNKQQQNMKPDGTRGKCIQAVGSGPTEIAISHLCREVTCSTARESHPHRNLRVPPRCRPLQEIRPYQGIPKGQ